MYFYRWKYPPNNFSTKYAPNKFSTTYMHQKFWLGDCILHCNANRDGLHRESAKCQVIVLWIHKWEDTKKILLHVLHSVPTF